MNESTAIEQENPIVAKIKRVMMQKVHGYFVGGEQNPLKIIWRMSGGNRKKAYELFIDVLKHYMNEVPTIEDFDDYAADVIGGGCEVEWNTYE